MKLEYEYTSFDESEIKMTKQIYVLHPARDNISIKDECLNEFRLIINTAFKNVEDAKSAVNHIEKNLQTVDFPNSWFILNYNICKGIDWNKNHEFIEVTPRIKDFSSPHDNVRVSCIVEERKK